MQISSSNVTMASQHSSTEVTKSVESLKTRIDKDNAPISQVNSLNQGMDTLDLSVEAKNLQLSGSGAISEVKSEEDSTFPLSESDKRKIELLESFIKSLTGKKIKFLLPKNIQIRDPTHDFDIKSSTTINPQPSQKPQNSGWGLVYDRSITHYESESTSFSAQGAIKTEDGREINVDLQLNLSREFISKSELSVRGGDAVKIDPLVLNFDAPTAAVTAEKYQFDIDANGTVDQISFAGAGSGFLALDLNNDSIINDGNELFGPKSGNGFSDLAAYDIDKNSWIDENDAIFDKLRIWSKDADGKDYLFALGEKGIGAIYLGNISTSYALKDSNNQTDAQLQRTGIFLNESGTAGTIQHIDLSV